MTRGILSITILCAILGKIFAGQWSLDSTTTATVLVGVGTSVSYMPRSHIHFYLIFIID